MMLKNHQKIHEMETNDLNKLTQEAVNLNSENLSETMPNDTAATPEMEDQAETDSDNTPQPNDYHQVMAGFEEQADIAHLEQVDLNTLTKQEMVDHLRHVVQDFKLEQIRDEVEAIKTAYYKIHHGEIEAQKAAFIEAGNPEEAFVPAQDPLEHELKELLRLYKEKRSELNESLEHEKEHNLTAKTEVIEGIKALINRQESLNDTFHEFRELQQKWREIGPVPQGSVRDLWANYNHTIENFYSYIKINKELRDLDLKKNYEAKLILCEKAEKLLLEPSIVQAFNALQRFHDEWREIGPVPNEKKEEIWERFKEATSHINKKHQEYFEGIKDQLKKNLDAKVQLCEKAEEIVAHMTESPKDWEQKSKELIEYQQLWKTIGFAPKKDNNKIYERFRSACDKFFEMKREYFKDYKSEQQNNMQLKTELCLQAEALKSNTDWKKTTDEFIKIQKRWKEIGPVPRKQSDIIWKRFRAACDEFFENKAKHFNNIDGEQDSNLKLKEQIIEELKNFSPNESADDTFRLLQEYQKKWSEIGHVPFKEKDRVNHEFRGLVNKLFDNLNLDEFHKNVQKFDSKLGNLKGTDHFNEKVSQERNKILNKLKQLETDITLWENNIGFFAKSKNSDALIKDFNNKIENGKRNIKLLHKKLDMIDDML
jgi:hypothetical protein